MIRSMAIEALQRKISEKHGQKAHPATVTDVMNGEGISEVDALVYLLENGLGYEAPVAPVADTNDLLVNSPTEVEYEDDLMTEDLPVAEPQPDLDSTEEVEAVEEVPAEVKPPKKRAKVRKRK